MKEQFFMESNILKVVGGPVDFNDAAITGSRVDMQHFKRVTFIVIAAAGTTPSSHTLAFKQHTVASAGSPAVLSIANPYYHQVSTATEFTKVAPTVAADTYDIDTLVGDTKFVAVFEVLQEDLDVNNGYRWVSVDVTDAAGAQLGVVLAVGHGATNKPAYSQAV